MTVVRSRTAVLHYGAAPTIGKPVQGRGLPPPAVCDHFSLSRERRRKEAELVGVGGVEAGRQAAYFSSIGLPANTVGAPLSSATLL